MIPTADQLQAIVGLRSGDLAEIPFAVLLQALSVHRRSAVLEIERGPLHKSIVLEGGVPVDCRSNLAHETLSRFLAARGDFSEEKAQEYFQRSVARGIRFGQLLILEGVITASGLYRAMQQNLAKKLLDGFTWRTGKFRLTDELPEVESPLKIHLAQLLVTGISKFALEEEVNEAIGPLVGKTLHLHPNPPQPLRQIRLSPEQRHLTELLYEGRRIDELAAETTVDYLEIMRLVYALAVLGIVIPEERLAAVRAPAASDAGAGDLPVVELEPAADELATRALPPVAGPASLPPASAPVSDELATRVLPRLGDLVPGSPVSEAERDALMGAYLQYRSQDAFDLLGAAETASAGEIESRFLEYSQRFAPWRFRHVPDLAEKAELLFLAGGRAFGELSDAERRNALIVRRRHLREAGARKPSGDRFLIRSKILDAGAQFKKGKALARAGKHREALQQFEFAHDCDPQNSIYRAELAYCRFLSSPAAARSSLAELRETLRVDPDCALAIYFTGVIQSEVGEHGKAEENLRRAVKLMMPDRRPVEALKALEARKKAS